MKLPVSLLKQIQENPFKTYGERLLIRHIFALEAELRKLRQDKSPQTTPQRP